MTDEELREFAYHLRELRADLIGIRRDLETAASPNIDRAVQRAWNGAWAMLEHDLEVHIPRALALLAKTPPTFQGPRGGRRAGDAAIPASSAREAHRLVDDALAVLPHDDVDPTLAANDLADVAGMIHAAYQIADEMLKVVSPEDDQDESSA